VSRLRLLLGSIWEKYARGPLLLALDQLDQCSVAKRLELLLLAPFFSTLPISRTMVPPGWRATNIRLTTRFLFS
jgi:hypothetical protein